METIRLKLGMKNINDFQWATIIDCGDFDSDEMPTTLKDVSTILWSLCGCGVINLLAKEIGERLGVSYSTILSTLENIFIEYHNMSEEEAYEKTFSEKK